jgi:hypothetical protein
MRHSSAAGAEIVEKIKVSPANVERGARQRKANCTDEFAVMFGLILHMNGKSIHGDHENRFQFCA